MYKRQVPAVSCRAVPNGEVDYDFYQGIKNEILEVARKENEKKPLDAITLSLHGSMRIKKIGDAEGYLLEDLRKLFPDIPIFASLDMHTTMTCLFYTSRLLVDSISVRDYPVIQGLLMIFALQYVLINLVVDVLYGVINPKIRLD